MRRVWINKIIDTPGWTKGARRKGERGSGGPDSRSSLFFVLIDPPGTNSQSTRWPPIPPQIRNY